MAVTRVPGVTMATRFSQQVDVSRSLSAKTEIDGTTVRAAKKAAKAAAVNFLFFFSFESRVGFAMPVPLGRVLMLNQQ